MIQFADRVEAGRQLAGHLTHLRGLDVVIVGLPRGGVPVAAQVARALDAPLEVIVARKLGLPMQPEIAMGAISEGGVRVLNRGIIAAFDVSDEEIRTVELRERVILESTVAEFTSTRRQAALDNRVAVIVDDGMATGATVKAAVVAVRVLGASRVVVAVPVAPADLVLAIGGADEVVCVESPRNFRSVGYYYRDFQPTSAADVLQLLDDRGPEPR